MSGSRWLAPLVILLGCSGAPQAAPSPDPGSQPCITGLLRSTGTERFSKLVLDDATGLRTIKAAWAREVEKTGRRYVASIKFEPGTPDDPNKTVAADWVDLPKLTSLRVPGDRFTLRFRTTRTDNYLPQNTESLVNIDWVRIETGEEAAR